MARQTLMARDPGQVVSQLDGTLEVAGYIGGVTSVVRIGGGLLSRAGLALATRRAAATGGEEVVVGLFGRV